MSDSDMLLFGARMTVLGTFHQNSSTGSDFDMVATFRSNQEWQETKDWWAASYHSKTNIRCSIPDYLTRSVNAAGQVHFFQATSFLLEKLTISLKSNSTSKPQTALSHEVKLTLPTQSTGYGVAFPAINNENEAALPENGQIQRLVIIFFGNDIAVLIAEYEVGKLPASTEACNTIYNLNSTVAALEKISLGSILNSINYCRKYARTTFQNIKNEFLGSNWQDVEQNSPKLPCLASFVLNKDSEILDDWFNLLTLTPLRNGSGTNDDKRSLRDAELSARICAGLLPDFWHTMPDAVRNRLITSNSSHVLVDAGNSALAYRNRNDDTQWSVARVGRLAIVRAGTLLTGGNKARRSDFFNHFHYDIGDITLKTAALVCAQRACLALLRQEIATVAHEKGDAFENGAQKIQRKLAQYATGYIHRSLGLMEQDDYVYQTWHERLGVEHELQSITEDVNRLYQLAQTSRQEKVLIKQEAVADATTKLSMIALLGSLGALITGIFGMNMVIKSFDSLPLDAAIVLGAASIILFSSRKLMKKLLPMPDDHMKSLLQGILVSARYTFYSVFVFLAMAGALTMLTSAESAQQVSAPTHANVDSVAVPQVVAPSNHK